MNSVTIHVIQNETEEKMNNETKKRSIMPTRTFFWCMSKLNLHVKWYDNDDDEEDGDRIIIISPSLVMVVAVVVETYLIIIFFSKLCVHSSIDASNASVTKIRLPIVSTHTHTPAFQ